MKRILALVGVICLLALYVLTLFFAIFDNPATMGMFKASVAATILIPTLIYGYQVVFRALRYLSEKMGK